MISNNVVEPWLYGASTGISSTAIIVAAVFWTWLWGPIGLLLSTPLTVCLVVMGQYVPQLQFLDVMLGNAPVLPPTARFYQRLLAQDPDEAEEIAEEFISGRSLEALYDELIVPSLVMAERDRQRGSLTGERLTAVADAVRTIIEDYADWQPPAESPAEADGRAEATPAEPAPPPAPVGPIGDPVLCIGGRSLPDELAAAMLAQLLQRRGFRVARAAAATLERNELPSVSGTPVRILAICSLHSSAILQIRRIVRRLRPRLGSARIIACILNGQLSERTTAEAAAGTTADFAAGALADAVAQIERVCMAEVGSPAAETAAEAAAVTEPDAARCSLLDPGEIDEPQVHLCHGLWQAPEGGGDFAEAHRRADGTLVAMMAALRGESPAAKRLAESVKGSVRRRVEAAASPAELLEEVERDLGPDNEPGEAIPAIALFYRPDRRLLLVASAGSPEPILLRGEMAEPMRVPTGAPLLALRDALGVGSKRKSAELVLETGDRILFYTEGAVEIAHPERGFLEPAGLAALAREHRGFAGLTFLEHIVAGIRAFGDGDPEDDIVLLTLEVRDASAVGKLSNAAD